MYLVEYLSGSSGEEATFTSWDEAEDHAFRLLHEEFPVVIWDTEEDRAKAIVFQGEVFRP